MAEATKQPKNRCVQCGAQVPHSNDALVLMMKIDAVPWHTALLSQSEHLLPVVEENVVLCEGFPKYAQYLPGRPRARRERYVLEIEGLVREAYASMQARAN